MIFLEIVLRALVAVVAVIVLLRLNGLRSFSKMSSFDFATTVACGSVVASTVINPDKNVLYGVFALAGLFIVQAAVARLRTHTNWAQRLIDNEPILIMENGRILSDNLSRTKMTEDDLYGKLREANAFDLSRVHAVVFETTGDVSVLHGSGDPDETVSPEILYGVRR